jgi:hypothetical protein
MDAMALRQTIREEMDRSRLAVLVRQGQSQALVSALPANPVDGQEVYLQTVAGVWHLRYRAAASQWDVVGGAPLFAIGGSMSTSSTVAVALTNGPAITVPVSGVYNVDLGCFVQQNAAGLSGPFVSARVGSGGTAMATAQFIGQAQFDGASIYATSQWTLAAGNVVSVFVATSGAAGVSVSYSAASLRLAPVRLS